MRLWYRYFNDGDVWYRGYGKETTGNSAKFLVSSVCPISKQVRPILMRKNAPKDNSRYAYTEFDDYLKGLIEIANLVSEYVEQQKGNYHTNSTDSR